MLNKILVLIYESPIGHFIFKIQDYFESKRANKVLVETLSKRSRSTQIVQKSLLNQALGMIKRGLKSDHDVKDLSSGKITNVDIQDYAVGNHAQLSETLAKIYVYNGTDIKTETDKIKMIHKRLNHYSDLQKDVLKRRLLRQIRDTKDLKAKAMLQQEFKEKYLK